MSEVFVAAEVYEGLEAVRRSGATNMWDYNMVQRVAFDMEYYQTVNWLEENRKKYAHGVGSGGFEPISNVDDFANDVDVRSTLDQRAQEMADEYRLLFDY